MTYCITFALLWAAGEHEMRSHPHFNQLCRATTSTLFSMISFRIIRTDRICTAMNFSGRSISAHWNELIQQCSQDWNRISSRLHPHCSEYHVLFKSIHLRLARRFLRLHYAIHTQNSLPLIKEIHHTPRLRNSDHSRFWAGNADWL